MKKELKKLLSGIQNSLKVFKLPKDLKKEIYNKIKEYSKDFNKPFNPGETFIPASGKYFNHEELINGVEAILDGWWTEGRFAEQFSKKFCQFLPIENTILTNSGSSANFLTLTSLTSKKLGERRLMPGDEVITVAAAFPTTVNPIISTGCVPVFVDIELGTYNVNINNLDKAVSEKTKAVILAHSLGNPFNLNKVLNFCKKNNLWLIEDSCDALGSKYDNKHVGTFGDLSTFSFYPAHHITMGEGGAVCTKNKQLAQGIISLRDWGRDCWCKTGHDDTCGKRFSYQLGNLPYGYDHKYIYSSLGYNLKLTDMQAAIGLAQMDKLDGFIKKREGNFSKLYSYFKKYKDTFILPKAEENSAPSWFGFPLTIKNDSGFKRQELLNYLTKNKVGTRLLFGGNITKQPYFIDYKMPYRKVGELTNTDIVMKDTFWIGVQPSLTEEMIGYVTEKFDEFIKKY